MAGGQSTKMLAVPTPSRASPLPQFSAMLAELVYTTEPVGAGLARVSVAPATGVEFQADHRKRIDPNPNGALGKPGFELADDRVVRRARAHRHGRRVTSLQSADNAKVMGELQFRHVGVVYSVYARFNDWRTAFNTGNSKALCPARSRRQ